jgi:hypothetical protein
MNPKATINWLKKATINQVGILLFFWFQIDTVFVKQQRKIKDTEVVS